MRKSLIAALALALSMAGAAAALVLVIEPGGAFAGLTDSIRAMQATLQQGLVGGVRRWQESADAAALGALGLSCFLYGVFHAAGPGHGKAVLATYAATSNVRLSRVLLLSGVSAAMQATVAVALVGAAFWVLGTGARWITAQSERVLEPASYAAIAAVGLWLVVGGVRAALPRPAPARPAPAHAHGHQHGHGHDHGQDHGHDHGDHRGHGACCGGHHAPAPPADASLASGLALAAAAGLRPCTGSLLVLFLCFGMGLWTLGIVASYAIGLGTAITVAALAAGAHAARHPVAGLARLADLPAGTVRSAGAALRVAGGSVIVLLGATLLHAALKAPAHPLL